MKNMNSEQYRAMQAVIVIIVCFGIFLYTFTLERHVYCDWTGLEIKGRLAHETIFIFRNGTRTHYCCINISLLAFEYLRDDTGQIRDLNDIQIHCAMCGMLMGWNDPMVVWVYSTSYLNPTTHTATIVGLCADTQDTELCQSHFISQHGGRIIECPYIWPE